MKPFIYNLDFVKEQSKKNLFNVVSLFAGCGGSSTGYRLAGGKVLAVNEFIPKAQEAYNTNYPDTFIFKEDVRELTGQKILDQVNLKVGELDILDGSPPCASFSMAGNREKDWGKEKKYSDTNQRTDDLFYEYARIIKEVQPKVFVAENVKGLTIGSAKYLLGTTSSGLFEDNSDTICKTLMKCGYNVSYKVLNAKHFNVPQSRERLIIVGVRKDIKFRFSFPIGNTKEFVSLEEAFFDIQNNEIDIKESVSDTHEVFNKLKLLKEGQRYEKGFLMKASRKEAAKTLTASSGNIGGRCEHHWDDRKFTVKEAIRIMSFPDDYYLGENYKDRIERLGRAVPPLMMKAVAEEVYKQILSKI